MPLLLRRTVLAGLLILPALTILAQKKTPQRRAKPPTFEASDSIFFKNVFDNLIGERPDLSAPPAPGGGNVPGGGGGERPLDTADSGWSKVISAATIEDEVKSLKLKIDKEVSRVGEFKGRGYLRARTQFSTLAMLFGIIAEFDDDVRWKSSGPIARDLFAKTAANCKSGSQQVYDQAKLRRDQLGDLINGNKIEGKGGPVKADWSKVVDRGPIMKRAEASHQGSLLPMTANSQEFQANLEKIVREAEIVAAISEVLMKQGMEDAGDETYDGYAKRMKKAARDMVDAVKLKNHAQAQKAAGEISKSCAECHENYRG